MFKSNLESFKQGCIDINEDNFWDVSRVLLDKIEGPSYIYSKDRHNEYLRIDPFVAKKRCINNFKVDD